MHKVLRYIPTCLVAAIIGYLSLRRDIAMPSSLHTVMWEGADKLIHALMYFVLSLVLCWALQKETIGVRWQCVISICVSALYGGLMEILQGAYFAPRTADWWDWLADIAGGALAVMIRMKGEKDERTKG